MGEILILDKSKADSLKFAGFKYTVRHIDGKNVFVFIQTSELMKELNSKFEKGSFFVNKVMCF